MMIIELRSPLPKFVGKNIKSVLVTKIDEKKIEIAFPAIDYQYQPIISLYLDFFLSPLRLFRRLPQILIMYDQLIY